MPRARPRVQGLVLAVILGSLAHAAEAALPTAPFELRASPSTVLEGERLTIEVAPLAPEGNNLAEHPFDLYLSMLRDSGGAWIYLMPSGVWSATPTAYRTQATRAGFTPLGVRFEGVGPIGWYRVRVQFVKASADSPSRKNYVFQPLLAAVRIRPAMESWTRAVIVLGSLGLLTLGAGALILVLPRRSPARVAAP